MIDETEHTCKFCYYEYFDGRAYPCSMCVCGEERKDMFQPSRKLHKYGLIEKKDGEWATDFIDRKTEPTVDKDINVRSKDEPKTQMKTQNSNVISVYDGVSEAVRCAMCSNPNKSVRGCDGACSYDEKLYERIMKATAESVADTPQTEREGE